MKSLLIFPIFFIGIGVLAQSLPVDKAGSPKEAVELFFEAMHKQDTLTMRSLTHSDVSLKSIGKDETGKTRILSEDFGGFLKTLASLPGDMVVEEKVHDYEIKTDGGMAHVWTPYSFFVNGKLSHCGANSFQLIRIKSSWKIFSIVDTRRKDCD